MDSTSGNGAKAAKIVCPLRPGSLSSQKLTVPVPRTVWLQSKYL